MADDKNKEAHQNDSFSKEEADELNSFIKKKKIQNKVLEKIVDKLNSSEENKEFNIQYLVSFITGNCSTQEQKMVEQWINLSVDNTLLYVEFKKAWETTSINNDNCEIDINRAWTNFKVLADFKEELSPQIAKSKISKRRIYYYAARIAAVVMFSFGIYFLFNNEKPIDTVRYSSVDEQSNLPITLPDGSKITVKNGEEVEYSEDFSEGFRNVDFKGEAFFEVVSNPEQPMIIACENMRVKVLGTAFSLNNCKINDEISVYLQSGKLLFYSVDKDGSIINQVSLKPGQKGIYNKNSGVICKFEMADENCIAWKTGVLEFVNAPLIDVISAIENTYNIKVRYKYSIRDYLLTARFSNETPESILESLNVIYGFNYEIRDNKILIY